MKSLKSTLVAITMGFIGFGAISISADETEEKNIFVQIHKLSDSNTKIDLDVNGQIAVFDLPDLEVGEIRDIVTESGDSISVTKTESGLSVSINGEDINLPAIGGDMAAHFLKGGIPLHRDTSNSIQVVGDLTEEQIAIITDAFAAAGVDKEIKFTKGHQMRFITIGGEHGENVNFEFKGDFDHSWISDSGANVKVIKFGDGNGELHFEKKIIVLNSKDEKEN